MNILFVCTGNTCRSPLAQSHALARLREESDRFDHIQIASAGIFAQEGAPASDGACTVAKNHGLDLSAHRAQTLRPEHMAVADVVWTMSADQAAYLGALYPEAAKAIEPLAPRDIKDPFGGDLTIYEDAYQEIVSAFADRLKDLAKGESL